MVARIFNFLLSSSNLFRKVNKKQICGIDGKDSIEIFEAENIIPDGDFPTKQDPIEKPNMLDYKMNKNPKESNLQIKSGKSKKIQFLKLNKNPRQSKICSEKIESLTGISCMAAIPRYFFDMKDQTCKSFVYGGCGRPFRNNFHTLEECYSTCKTEFRGDESDIDYSSSHKIEPSQHVPYVNPSSTTDASKMMPDSTKHNVTQQKMGNRAPKEEFASGSADDLINHQGGGSSAEGPTVDLSLQFFESSSEEGN